MNKRILLKDLHLNDINPRVYGIKSYCSGQIEPPHHIQRHVIHYVTSGTAIYRFNGQELPVKEGDVFVCHPGYFTSYIPTSDETFTYMWVSFDCTPDFSALINQDVFPSLWSKPIFEQMLAAEETAVPEWTICARLYDFFTALVRRQPVSAPPPDDYVSRAVNFIQAHYPDNIQIADIAADLGLSRSYFCRIFKQRLGLSPQAYLVAYRLTIAASLLADQGFSQKEAALRVGYPDVYSFCRMFKQKYGIAPGTYVAQKQEK